jgi:hypothetical protein
MSFLSWLYGDDENAKRAADADAQLRAMNEERAKTLGDEWKARVEKNYETQVTFGVEAQNREIDAAFVEGWNDGKNNVTGFVKGAFKVVGDVLSSVILGIPAWVWLTAAGVVWFYLGTPGLKTLKSKLPK